MKQKSILGGGVGGTIWARMRKRGEMLRRVEPFGEKI